MRDYKPSETFPYQVAYDDSDDEWGYFTPTHFHTDEVNRKYSWLPDQDAVIAKAVATLNEQQESKGSKADADQSAPLPKSNSVPPSAAPSAGPKPIPLSLAAQKSLLRANKPATERGSASYDRPDADAQTVPTTNGKARFTSTEQQQPAATKVTSIKPDVKAAAVLQKSIAEAKSKAARSDPDEEASIAPNKRRKVSPGPDSNTPPKKRPSTSSMLADAKHLVHMRSKPTAPAALGAATAASSPVAQLSLQPAKDAQHQAEPKRRRLQKLSDASAAAQQAEPASDAEVKPENSQVQACHHCYCCQYSCVLTS